MGRSVTELLARAHARRYGLRRAGLAAILLVLGLAGCGERATPPPPADGLTAEDRAVWRTPAKRADRIPVLLYHGLAARTGFSRPADAAYGIDPKDFAKQMALLHHAGYQAITLERFRRFHAGEPVDLPAHPVLITFDDARADSAAGADPVLARYGWTATMFVDTGAVERRDPEYSSWSALARMQRSDRWTIQLHSGRGHHNLRYGTAARQIGPYYAFRNIGEREALSRWRRRAIRDILAGERLLRRHVPGYRRLAFAPPFGNYGQIATNDARIPRTLGRWLRDRYGLVFVQQPARQARRGDADVPRLQITRKMTGGDLHAWLTAD